MPSIPIIMPQLGESIAEATIINFLVQKGEKVVADQNLLEVETNKAVMTVTAPCEGVLEEWSASLNESYPVGTPLGKLTVSQERAALFTKAAPQVVTVNGSADDRKEAPLRVKPTVRGLPVPIQATGASFLSPRVRARMDELGLNAADLAGVAGRGSGGRITVQDLEQFLLTLEQHQVTDASSMRMAVADGMRRSWTRPLVTAAVPVALDQLLLHRQSQNPKPGPALYALRALALALAADTTPVSRLVGSKLVHPGSLDIGVAVEVPDGVLVPVIRQTDKKTLAELTPFYQELIDKARLRQLPADATGGAVATITNFGGFGLTWATPIPLPEQTLVLGLGAARKMPVWSDEKNQFVPVMEANLTLSFDHRVMDGGAAGRLLTKIAGLMQTPEKL